MSRVVPLQRPRDFGAGFVNARPGDTLTHPRTGAPITTVLSVNHATMLRRRGRTRYRITIVAEDLETPHGR